MTDTDTGKDKVNDQPKQSSNDLEQKKIKAQKYADYYKTKAKEINEKRKLDRKIKKGIKHSVNNDLDNIHIMPINVFENIPIYTGKYIERSDLFYILDLHKDMNQKLLITGKKGTGKTEGVIQWSAKNKIPLVMVNCFNGMTDKELLGTYQIKNNESVFILGSIPKVIELANLSPNKMAVLLIDEMSCLNNDTQKILNEMLNVRRGINIPKLNKTYRLNQDSKVLIVGTKNPSYYIGTNELNIELVSRFNHFSLDDWTDKEIEKLCTNTELDLDIIPRLINFKNQINSSVLTGKLSYEIDPRQTVRFCLLYNRISKDMDKTKALSHAVSLTMLEQYNDKQEELRLAQEIAESNFGI